MESRVSGKASMSRVEGSPRWRGAATHTIRYISVLTLSTVMALSIISVLDSQILPLPAAAATAQWNTTAAYAPLANVRAVSCAPSTSPTSATCVAVGDDGGNVATVIVTNNGGSTWSRSTAPAGVTTLSTVSCPSASVCYAGGDSGIMKSSDGGSIWTIQDSTFPAQSISCFTIDECTAVEGIRIVETTEWLYLEPSVCTFRHQRICQTCRVRMRLRVRHRRG